MREVELLIRSVIPSVRLVAVLLCGVMLLTSCYKRPSAGGGNISLGGEEKRLTIEENKIAIFDSGAVDGFWARNDRGNGPPFNCSFSNNNAVIDGGLLTISLTEADGRYVGAEYRSMAKFSYGFFSVRMKAAKGDGIISSFFTYTGRPWDEIDIEFLGNDTTIVQFNYYTRGVGNHEYLYDLGFDASEDFHEYAFDWQPDSITWYVDGRAVYRATKDIPTTAGQLMVNIWNVADSNADWAGRFDPSNLPARAEYQWFGYSPSN